MTATALQALPRRVRIPASVSFSAMAANPLRTALCTLGVVMGIASVIATLALADGLDRYARDQIVSSTDVQAVAVNSRTQVYREGFAFPNRAYPVFTLRDADDLQDFLGADGTVTMSVGGSAVVGTATAPPHAASVNGTLANYLLFGMRDVYAGLSARWPELGRVRGVELSAFVHHYDSDRRTRSYGDELNLLASATVRGVTWSARYAYYVADRFATDTRKLWLTAEWAL